MTTQAESVVQPGAPPSPAPPNLISLERQVRIGAGTMAILGVVLGFFVHRLFYALGLVVGVGLIVAGLTEVCGLALLLAKMPWNRHRATCCAGSRET